MEGTIKGGDLHGIRCEQVKKHCVRLLETRGEFKTGDLVWLGSGEFVANDHAHLNTDIDVYHLTKDGAYHVCVDHRLNLNMIRSLVEDKLGKQMMFANAPQNERCHGQPNTRRHFILKVKV